MIKKSAKNIFEYCNIVNRAVLMKGFFYVVKEKER